MTKLHFEAIALTIQPLVYDTHQTNEVENIIATLAVNLADDFEQIQS